jgi:anti-sigma B factor antagonist
VRISSREIVPLFFGDDQPREHINVLGGESMEIEEKRQEDISIFKISGRLDSNTSPGFEEKILEAIQSGSHKMIIDFKDLEYISSAGLRVLNKATKQLKHSEGRIILCSMQDYIREVFEIAGFDSFLPIVSTLDEALLKF